MRILICDDDNLIIKQINKFLESYFRTNHLEMPDIVSFTNGVDLLSDEDSKDIVFLDIEMPGMNGIYVGKELKRMNKNVIIFVVTSYSEYLDDAMRFHVFRYLSKPLDKQRFFRNLKDALNHYSTMTTTIPIETKDGVYTCLTSQLIAIEAQYRKVIAHTTKGSFVSIHNANHWLSVLPKNQFFQTHRSFIINFEHVVNFDHNTIHLTNPAVTAYLTRRKYNEFKNTYLLYLESTR